MAILHWLVGAAMASGALMIAAFLVVAIIGWVRSVPAAPDPLSDMTARLQRVITDAEQMSAHIGEEAGAAVKQEALKMYEKYVLSRKAKP